MNVQIAVVDTAQQTASLTNSGYSCCLDHCKNFVLCRKGSSTDGAAHWCQIACCPDGAHSSHAHFPFLKCLVLLWRLFQWFFFSSGVLPKQLLNKCMKVLCFQFTVKFKYSLLIPHWPCCKPKSAVRSQDRSVSICNTWGPFLKSHLPGVPYGVRVTLLSWLVLLPLVRDHQYQRGSPQRGHLPYSSRNKTSCATAFGPLQTCHKSLRQCIFPLCTGNVLPR